MMIIRALMIAMFFICTFIFFVYKYKSALIRSIFFLGMILFFLGMIFIFCILPLTYNNMTIGNQINF